MVRENQHKYNQLRREYNVFTFERFEYKFSDKSLSIQYYFNLGNEINFSPKLKFDIPNQDVNRISEELLENLIFHIGMIELVSYWKATCSPHVVIKPFKLTEDQIEFWKKLYLNGLGEFFYLNGIQVNRDDFISIKCIADRFPSASSIHTNEKSVLVPVGGGKDSVVTLEILKNTYSVSPFIINPRKASLESARVAGFNPSEIIEVSRNIDPKLLELNNKGFLNGHTPFSALLAFVSLLSASVFGFKYIALSNESSANEPTVLDGPNHQYSKSFEFENDFRDYVRQFISPDIEYFSFLRPCSELKIASIFSKFPRHLYTFRSCNVGSKEDKWCGHCPKCLFTTIIISPFIDLKKLNKIFGKNMLDDKQLIPVFNELVGIADVKPFECVGTVDEINKSLILFIKKSTGDLPALVAQYTSGPLYNSYKDQTIDEEMSLGREHFLPQQFYNLLTPFNEK